MFHRVLNTPLFWDRMSFNTKEFQLIDEDIFNKIFTDRKKVRKNFTQFQSLLRLLISISIAILLSTYR